MKSTWDHHLVGRVYIFEADSNTMNIELKNINTGYQYKPTKQEFLKLAKNFDIPVSDIILRDIPVKYIEWEIVKNGSDYYWVNNGNKKITKRLEQEGRWNFYIYETEDKSESIKIRHNGFEVDGCNARPHSYIWGVELEDVLDDKTILLAKGNSDYYQNPIQYYLCPELSASQDHTMFTRLFY